MSAGSAQGQPRCPHLQYLALSGTATRNLQTMLSGLSELTHLSLDCIAAAAGDQLAVLVPQLRSLQLLPPSELREMGLLQLTQLRCLTQLQVYHQAGDYSKWVKLTSKVRV